MVSKTVTSIKEDVRILLDENVTGNASLLTNNDNLELNQIIEQSIIPAVRWAHMNAPQERLLGMSMTYDAPTPDADIDYSCNISLPVNYMRFISVRANTWRSPVTRLVAEDTDKFHQLTSGYPGLAGNGNIPAAAFVHSASGRSIQLFSYDSNGRCQLLNGSFETGAALQRWYGINGLTADMEVENGWLMVPIRDAGISYGSLTPGQNILTPGHKYYIQARLQQMLTDSHGVIIGQISESGTLGNGIRAAASGEVQVVSGIITATSNAGLFDFAIVDDYNCCTILYVNYVMMFDLTELGFADMSKEWCDAHWTGYTPPAGAVILRYMPEPEITGAAIPIENNCYEAVLYYIAHLVSVSLNVEDKYLSVAEALIA